MKILLVDDEPGILLTLAANLELDGFDVSTAENGEAALELFGRETFDLVLSDVRMPGMNGVELFRRIREMRPDFPVVLMTGFALEELIHDAIVEGVFAVLPKPFDVEEVVASLTRAAKSPMVMIVERDCDAGRSTADALCALGIRAVHHTDAASALVTVKERAVDVCVIDMNLPKGTALMDELRKIDAGIVQIAIAGHDIPNMMRQAAARGSFACLPKPVNPTALVEVIARARGAGASP
jgi:DNA-binding NtrC family response regulator